jgi:hypothetical protein
MATIFHPHRRRNLNLPHKVSQGYRWMKIGENMQVILNTINTIEMAVLVFYYSTYVGI